MTTAGRTLPGTRAAAVRTRVMWDNRRGRSASGVAGVTFEKREGGSAFAHQELETKEADGALFGQMPLGKYILAGAGTLFVQSRTRDFSDRREHERRQSATIEITLRRTKPRHTWLAGIASDWFANRTPATPLPSAYVYTGPSIFFHDEMQVASWFVRLGQRSRGSPRQRRPVRESAGFGPRARRAVGGTDFGRPELLFPEAAHRGNGSGGPRAPDDRQRGDLERETANSVSADLTHTTPTSVFSITVFRTQVEQSRPGRPRDVHAPHRIRSRRHARRRDPRHGAPAAVRGDRHVRILAGA